MIVKTPSINGTEIVASVVIHSKQVCLVESLLCRRTVEELSTLSSLVQHRFLQNSTILRCMMPSCIWSTCSFAHCYARHFHDRIYPFSRSRSVDVGERMLGATLRESFMSSIDRKSISEQRQTTLIYFSKMSTFQKVSESVTGVTCGLYRGIKNRLALIPSRTIAIRSVLRPPRRPNSVVTILIASFLFTSV